MNSPGHIQPLDLNAAIQVTDEVSLTKHFIPNILWHQKLKSVTKVFPK